MTTIATAFAHIQAHPAPVLFIDTCSLLDLFRRDSTTSQPRVPAEEIRAATDILAVVNAFPNAAHLVVPELIPREYADHANKIQQTFEGWTRFHDENQTWLVEAALCVGIALPAPVRVHLVGLANRFRLLANDLLTRATVLDRDQTCLDRAVYRLIHKQRPSHSKEMKDSMNMEQCLELSSQLQAAGFPNSRIFVSSNTHDFAQTPTSSQLHTDLRGIFTSVGLAYFTSLRAALGHLRANGEM